MTTPTVSFGSPEAPADLEWKVQRAPDGGLYQAKANVAGVVSLDEDSGIVDAIVSVTGIVDEVDDVILPGAYAATLKQRVPKGVWSHDWTTWVSRTDKVGEIAPRDSDLPTTWKGKPWPAQAGCARVRTAFNLGTTAGRDAFSNVKFFDAGELGQQVEWSIGYHVPAGQAVSNSQGWRLIKALQWFEYCPVLFGAMPLAGTLPTDERKSWSGGPVESKAVRERIVVASKGWSAPAGPEHAEGDRLTEQLDVAGKGWTPTDAELRAEHERARAVAEAKLAGQEVTPGDVASTERLKRYWTHGVGAAKVQWGVPHDFYRCLEHVGKYMPPGEAKGYCANRHHDATGFWPGHAPTERKDWEPVDPAGKGADMQPTERKDATVEPEDTGVAAGAGTEPEDDDPDDRLATGLDPEDEDYPTDGDEPEEKAAGGAMACGKSRGACPHTMPDDSYPIHDAAEVTKAVTAYPRGAGSGKSKGDIRRHIVTRAKAVGATKKVPNTWPEKRGSKGLLDRIGEALGRKDYPYLPGSVEERLDVLQRGLNDLLLPEPDDEGRVRAYVSIDGTYPDRVIATMTDYTGDNPERETFVIPYTVSDPDDDGDVDKVAFGDPQPADKVVSIAVTPKGSDGGEGSDAGSGDAAAGTGGVSPLTPIGTKIAGLAEVLGKALAGEEIAGRKAAPGPEDVRVARKAAEGLEGLLAQLGVAVAAVPDEGTGDGTESKDLGLDGIDRKGLGELEVEVIDLLSSAESLLAE